MSAVSYPPPPRLRLRADWSGANMTDGDLSGSDLSNADLTDVNFERTNLTGTILKGADLTGARNLTHEQLSGAVLDETTKLPLSIDRSKLITATP
jgi:uncharacterized protein YjbI with pentapeptide repeats